MTNYILEWDRDFAFEQSADDIELLRELMDILDESSTDEFNKLEEAHKTGNFSDVMETAHSIKGAAFNLGVNALGRVAKEMEQAALKKREEAVNALLPKLKKAVMDVKLLKETI